MEATHYQLTCSIGRFIFSDEVPLFVAKRIRDVIMGKTIDKEQSNSQLTLTDIEHCLDGMGDRYRDVTFELKRY